MDKLTKDIQNIKDNIYKIGNIDNARRKNILNDIKESIDKRRKEIIDANEIDVKNASYLSESMIDRLKINDKRIDDIISSIDKLNELNDCVGEVIERFTTIDGLDIEKVRVPFGIICVIYEARPNVTIDLIALAIKTSNACVLRGGKEAINTNKKIVEIVKDAIKKYDIDECIYLVEDLSHEVVNKLIKLNGLIDLVIPRGGKNLINNVVNNASVPVIETGAGNCHMYVEASCDFDMAIKLIINGKTQRPSVCNAVESILIDDKIKDEFLPLLKSQLDKYNVIIKGCKKTKKLIDCIDAQEEDYYQEYNDLIVNIKVIDGIDAAIKHINKYSTHHSDCIITNNNDYANRFLNEIDSACVYVNASTRFTDGGCFGFGAEVGISTQKMHARGPMGIRELMSYKYKIIGQGQVRK